MKKILYISYDGLTDPLGQSQILPYITALSKEGYHFTIISAEKREKFDLQRKELIKSQIQSLPITWMPILYHKKPPILSTIFDLWKMYQKAKNLVTHDKFHLVHCRSYLSALIGERLFEKFQIPFLFDMRGFWADERIDGKLWKLQNPLYRAIYQFFKKKEKDFLQKAAFTISLTYNAKNEIHTWKGFEKVPIAVIPCCVDTELFCPQQITNKAQALTISYVGSIGTWYLLKEMLIFYKLLLQKYPETQFLFITTEPAQVILQEAEKLQLPLQQIKIQKAERYEVPILLAQSHLAVFFIKNSYSKKASSPTKMAEILAMGIPIITNNIGDNALLFEKYNYGYLLNDLSTESMQKAIEQIPEILKKQAENLRAIAKDYFDLMKGITTYKQVYEKIFAKEQN